MEKPDFKMKVEIWSDVMCPFCYIGKRRFEKALADFTANEKIEIIWKSYQLAPDMKTDPDKNINQYLAEHKGISVNEAKQMNDYVTKMAAAEGLVYNFDKAIVANSFKAHRFSHFAKQYGLQHEAEEVLFRAYFTDGLNTDDTQTLIDLGNQIGLDGEEIKHSLESGSYSQDVLNDIKEAVQIGVRGVPFFVFNRRYAVSGAQDVSVFKETLDKSFKEWQEQG